MGKVFNDTSDLPS